MQDNQFESIIKECQITSSSQEESPSSPVQVTGIIMVSPPESNAKEEEEEVFHTPPDINRSQSIPSSDDAGPEIRPDNPQFYVVGGLGDAVMSGVDLGKDSGTLGFSEPNSIVYGDDDDDCVKKHVICCEANESKVELDSKNMSEVEFDHRSENSRHTELMVIASTENVESAKVSEEDTESFVDKQVVVTYANSGGGHIFRSGDTREGVLARRPGLPNSNVGGAIVPWQSLDDRDTVNDLFNAAGILFDDTTDDTDFLEAAMECSITFHRPRWWPE